jgi:hypothetical protein
MNGLKSQGGYGIHSYPEHFYKIFQHCLKGKIHPNIAMLMAKKLDSLGSHDAGSGCIHYRLHQVLNKDNTWKLFK